MKKSIRHKVGKRIASIALSTFLAFTGVGLLPQLAMPVHAADSPYNINLASIQETFNDSCTIQINGNGTVTSNTIDITVASGKTVTINLNGVNIDVSSTDDACAFKISGAGNVVINLTGSNIIKSGMNCAGLQKDSLGILTILGTGSLEATGGVFGAGIGGGNVGDGSYIYISGGTVTATGGIFGAGIGGGKYGDGYDIEISDGTVTATGFLGGAGIGGGSGIAGGRGGDGYNISISGSSTVMVAGGLSGAGVAIGSGGFLDSNNSPIDGTEFAPDISGLYTTGSIRYYPAGTTESEISNGTVQPTSTFIGSVSIQLPVNNSSELEPPVNYMQEVEDQINAAIRQGGPQTVTIKGYDTLSYDVLKLLSEHEQITLISEFTYKGVDFKLTMTGDKVELMPDTKWYGPKCLYPMFYSNSTDTFPEVNTYLEIFK